MHLRLKWLGYIFIVLVVPHLAACGSVGSGSSVAADTVLSTAKPYAEVREIMPGVLQGYLSDEEQLDSRVFVPPAPAETSALQSLDNVWSERMLTLRGSLRWDVAIRDADLGFPAAADTFACALDFTVSEEETPALYMLLRRTLTDIGLATYPAKNSYQRERPFMSNGQATCTPDDETALRKDGSYPSGHTAIGWGWALILSELAPDRSEQILARGRAFGESRTVCNVHWYSDVVAGRLVGAAAVTKLHGNRTFREGMEAVRLEIEKMSARDQPVNPSCAIENEALSVSLEIVENT